MSAKKQYIKGDDSLEVYLHEIGETDLLTPKEEKVLAYRIREGDESAVDRMVTTNLRFVVSVAKKYQNRGLSLSDLISEGNIGLMTAARRFDENRGYKFISYAVWWIRQAILSAIAGQSRLIRLPLNKVEELNKIKQSNREREMMLGDEGVETGEVNPLQPIPEWAGTPWSLDALMGEHEDYRLMDRMKDQDSLLPDEVFMEDAMKKEIGQAVASLTSKEGEILNLYFGLNTDRAYTLEEIGNQFGVTRERIRQIKEKAINKLRHKSRSRRLAPFAE